MIIINREREIELLEQLDKHRSYRFESDWLGNSHFLLINIVIVIFSCKRVKSAMVGW